MAKLRKLLLLFVVLGIAAGLAVGGTIAYLTDRDSEVNVFSLGQLDIRLDEVFKQESTLTPGVGVQKEVQISNIGKTDAWVWVEIAVPTALDEILELNYTKNDQNEMVWSLLSDDTGAVMVNKGEDGKGVVIEEKRYNVYTVLCPDPVLVGDVSSVMMSGVALDADVDIAPDGQWYQIVHGAATKIDWNSKEDTAPVIHVSAYGIQYNGFETVLEAYDAYRKQMDAVPEEAD